MISALLFILFLLLAAPAQSRGLEKKSPKAAKVQEIDIDSDVDVDVDDTEEDRALPDGKTDLCLMTAITYTDPNDNYFDSDLMQAVMLDTPVCFDKGLEHCTSPEGNKEFANGICHVLDPCFDEEGCLSYLLCNQVITEETRGVVLTGSGIAEFDLTSEDGPIIGTSEFMFMLPDVAGKVMSVFDDDIVTHTVCYTWFKEE